jgi:hypothetical protein
MIWHGSGTDLRRCRDGLVVLCWKHGIKPNRSPEVILMPPFKLGDPIGKEQGVTRWDSVARSPVVLQVQPDSFIRLETPEELRAWEDAVRATTGLKIDASEMRGSASESCSCGCTDDSCVDCE